MFCRFRTGRSVSAKSVWSGCPPKPLFPRWSASMAGACSEWAVDVPCDYCVGISVLPYFGN